MPKTYSYPARWARYEAAAVYALAMIFVFANVTLSDRLFPDPQEDQRQQITEEVSQNG